jgi:hypothetical protein
MTEWRDWERKRATAHIIESNFQLMRVTIDDLEDEPDKCVGRGVSADAEVDRVYGPRLFTTDDRSNRRMKSAEPEAVARYLFFHAADRGLDPFKSCTNAGASARPP